MEEIWKDIKGYGGLYQASNLGKIKSLSRRYRPKEIILKSAKNGKYNHQFVGLYKNNIVKECFIHRLVLETFIGPCPLRMECRHLDGSPKNNRLDNLCWGTHKDNVQDSISHNTHYTGKGGNFNTGINNGSSKLNEKQVRIIRWLLQDGKLLQREIATIFNVSRRTIGMIKNHQIWSHIN